MLGTLWSAGLAPGPPSWRVVARPALARRLRRPPCFGVRIRPVVCPVAVCRRAYAEQRLLLRLLNSSAERGEWSSKTRGLPVLWSVGSACPWRGNARPTRLSPSVAASGPPVGPRGRSGPSWPVSVSVTTRGNHPGHPTVVLPLPLRPTAVTPLVAHRLAGRRCVVPRCVRARPGGCLAL